MHTNQEQNSEFDLEYKNRGDCLLIDLPYTGAASPRRRNVATIVVGCGQRRSRLAHLLVQLVCSITAARQPPIAFNRKCHRHSNCLASLSPATRKTKRPGHYRMGNADARGSLQILTGLVGSPSTLAVPRRQL